MLSVIPVESYLKQTKVPLWKEILRKNFNYISILADFLELSQDQREQLDDCPKFPIQVPVRIAQKMIKGSLDDPLFRQFVPLKKERQKNEAFVTDPVCDASFQKGGKLLHKYEGRALLLCTSACAMHCRYCFRQNFDYQKNKLFDEEIAWISQDSSIHEVILSGGDPLSLSQDLLSSIMRKISLISHVKRIRFHTRFPIGIPERIDDDFLEMIDQIPQQIYFVIHCNHPHEIDKDVLFHLKKLQKKGCVVLNQAVLLHGVNDNVETLLTLCEKLADEGILPYYLHQLDRVEGASHFEVSEAHGKNLIKEVAKRLSGYAVPKYVREIAGESNKTVLY